MGWELGFDGDGGGGDEGWVGTESIIRKNNNYETEREWKSVQGQNMTGLSTKIKADDGNITRVWNFRKKKKFKRFQIN